MARSSLLNVISMIEEVEKKAPIEQKFLSDLKKAIEEDYAANRREGSNYYKPSSMHCIRAMFYARTNAPKDPPDDTYVKIGICNSGTDIHERIQTAVSKMKDYGFDCEYIDVAKYVEDRQLPDIEVIGKSGMETKLFNQKYKISFLCDGIIRYKGKFYILELKTETSRKWYPRENVDGSHHTQATCYSLCLGIDKVLFVYINRDNLDMKSFMFEVSDEMKLNVSSLLIDCEGYVDRLITPPKPVQANTTWCKKNYCNYCTQCRKDG